MAIEIVFYADREVRGYLWMFPRVFCLRLLRYQSFSRSMRRGGFVFFSFLLYFSCPSERCIADAEVASLVQASIPKKNESSSTNCAFGVKRHYAASHPFWF